jgi:hypothetical protein
MADDKTGGTATHAQDGPAVADIHMKIAAEYATRARHHDIVRATIDVGLITFTSLSFVLYAAIYARPDPNVYVLMAIAVLVITLGVFGLAFTAGREISIRRWLAASDERFRAAIESAGGHPDEEIHPQNRLPLLTYVVYALMAAAMIAPGAILLYAACTLLP